MQAATRITADALTRTVRRRHDHTGGTNRRNRSKNLSPVTSKLVVVGNKRRGLNRHKRLVRLSVSAASTQ